MSLDTFNSGNLFFSLFSVSVPDPQPLSSSLGFNLPLGRNSTPEINSLPTANADLIMGTIFQDNIFALGGNDTVYGLEGNDILGGNQQADQIFGNQGNDSLYGGQDRDTLAGGQDSDLIFGDQGDDLLLGDRGADTLFGNQDNDRIYGGKENDFVTGGDGDDQLFGDLGDDILYGDLGADMVTGGEGNDLFYMGKTMGGFTITEADIIEDFTLNQDSIGLLENLTFSDLNIAQGTGNYANDTIIQDKNSNEYLAILKNVNSNSLSSDDFIFNGSDPTPSPTPDPTPIPTPSPTPSPTPIPTPSPTPAPLSVLGFSAANFSVNENGTPQVDVSVTRTGNSVGNVGVTVNLNNGTATAPDDYNNSPISINFADGDTTPKIVTIPIVDDSLVEGDETLDLSFSNIIGDAILGTQSTATLTILDNDVLTNPGTLAFSIGNIDINENAGTATVTVNRTGGTDGIVGINYTTSDGNAIAGNDYTPTSGTLTFAAGQTNQTFTVNIIDDTLVEGNETFNLSLSNITGGAILGTLTTSTITIVENDLANSGIIAFSSENFSINENGTPINTITINRTGGSSGLVTAQITPTDGTATAVSDYNNTPLTVTFVDGDIASKTITIPVIDDTVFEPTETLNLGLTLTAGTATLGTQNTATLQIVDNDPSDNLLLNSATYLGTTGSDSAASVEISPVDNNIIVAGNFNGVGEIQRLQNGNTAPLSNTPLGGVVNDLDVDRDSGEIVAVGDFGIKVYNPTANTVLWSQPGTFNRVAIANDGTVATLNNSTDTVTLWSPTGTLLTSTILTGTNVNPADIAIDPMTKQVFVTGYNQVSSILQTPFLRGFDSSLNLLWKTWDFTAAEVTGQNLGADTRGERITIGQDGGLYFLGKTDGGNNVFQRNGQTITETLATLVNIDSFNNFSGAGAGSFTFHSKINPNTGTIDQGQFIVTRTSTGANSFTPNSITADEFGNVYIGGSSAFQLQNRPTKTINSQPVGAYTLGEMAVLGLSADYTVRKFWTPLTQTGDADGAKGTINGFTVAKGQAVILGTVTQASVPTTVNAINPNPLGGNDAYLATWSV
ncbi:Calx-beta domain-containing protein [Planktothrix mougeotii]|uniref:SBBP repeat-containing protein n=1 Tax=Planktothrix mougeotii LEGE 06226 TaxID=1828728 RepID=A0ABR9UDV7_9CYAN|nr:Calx-beta domain-containing protein [Planktothrix mougeotii]MBE9144651.1 SBBP repeat-containing protein [Planktothrix mougeotii LEGE 06226]